MRETERRKKSRANLSLLQFPFNSSPALDTRSATVSPLGPPPAMTRSTSPLDDEGSNLGSSRSHSRAWFSADRARKLFDVGVGASATAAEATGDFDAVLPPSK